MTKKSSFKKNVLNTSKISKKLIKFEQKMSSEISSKVTDNYNKLKKKIFFIDKILFVGVFCLIGIFNPVFVAIGSYFALFFYLIATGRRKAFYHLLLSSSLSIVWNLFARKEYGYNTNMLVLFGFNLFPLFAWAIGLFGVHLIYSQFEKYLKHSTFKKQFIAYLLLFWPTLILIETVSYHLFDIHNLTTSMYPGLPICNCIHAPVWMQISYFMLGPIYFLLCKLFKLELFVHIDFNKELKKIL